jgi:predicted ATP-grasp superfamily ATP-dependent carboligase
MVKKTKHEAAIPNPALNRSVEPDRCLRGNYPGMRVLLSEGASTSARQAITALGLRGHDVEICDPSPFCLGRFSRFVSQFHRCPGMGIDPQGYFSFVTDLLASRRFDVLLPIHDQGFLFAAVRRQLPRHVAVALPSFESYERVHGKAEFSRLLSELNLPQPETRIIASGRDFDRDLGRDSGEVDRFPFVLKASIGTASRGTWMVHSPADLQQAMKELEATGGLDDPIVVQQLAAGFVEHAQAVFCNGRLIGHHAYRQLSRGVGGGDAIKESIRRPVVRAHLAQLGEQLHWHGALSVDYIFQQGREVPLYIDCNPRLVEPMSAVMAGVDLMELLIEVSCGDTPPVAAEGRPAIRTSLAIQALFGCAILRRSRWTLLGECWRLLFKRGPYAGSREELTPVRWDWASAIPAMVTALWLLMDPRAAHYLPRRGWGSHLLNPQCARTIRSMSTAHVLSRTAQAR